MIKKIYLGFILVCLYLPLLVIFMYSFNVNAYSSQWQGFTLDWYRTLWQDQTLWQAGYRSLLLAFSTGILTCYLATITAITFYRYRFQFKKFLFSLLLILIIIPDLLFGVSLLMVYNALGISLGYWSLLGAHVSFSFPFVLLILLSRLKDFDKHILEAAQDLGASDWLILKKILLPILIPTILSGGMLTIALSLDDVIISYFVSGPDYEILPLRIYSLIRIGVNPEINALFSLLLIVTSLLSFGLYRLNYHTFR